MKQRFFSIFASLLLIATASCTRYLDMTPTDKVSDKVLWRTTETAEYGVNYIYSYVLDIYGWQSAYGFSPKPLPTSSSTAPTIMYILD